MKVFIIAALTADGFIARDDAHTSTDWTSAEDKQMYRQATKDAGVMVMGSRTFATIGRGLPGRRTIVYTRNSDSLNGIDGVEATSEEPAVLLRRLAGEGASQVAICGGSHIYSLFLKAGVVDELWLTVEPVLFGKGVSLFNESHDVRLELLQARNLNQNTMQHIYKIVR